MFIARIDGSITSTVKHKSLRGLRLLIGQRLTCGANLIMSELFEENG